ncbi:thioredoxin domain-containing protein [Halovenus salina]|uniref:thioredoxin domain-containing protein n=1 Tax=Halovenus salina TaxID=1510225 RepID=UPI002260F8D3|nr:thioredoxin domain-containing protein [Halovenus salina]
MTEIAGRNRLDEEESPYLRDHADNPVNWQPWDDQALEEARERDVPIFLSVGYSACHWCHVMADESFADESVAEVLNENFVPIKVDREERPDVDRIYQTLCQQVSGRGGWPLSVWLTPDQKPFYVGTYFPRESRRGMPGFLELLEDITESWNDSEERAEMEDRAEKWTDAVEGELETVPDQPHEPDEDAVEQAAKAAVRAADREYGGWGSGPKFPHAGRLHILLRAHQRTERDVYLDVVEETLDAMANGGMYDHIGGGFHRYATDRDWTVPHFEKMLYDNAELPRAYLAGYQATGKERYATVARETLDFVERELTDDDGGFFATLDAQSETDDGEREEGAYYVWTPEEVQTAVDDETDAELFCERYGVTRAGNFEGATVLTFDRSLDSLADEYDLTDEEIKDALDRARQQVAQRRDERARPHRDEKVLASWNGLMIRAFGTAALVLDEAYAEPAVAAAESVLDTHWDEDEQRLKRRHKDGVTKIDGYLDDYAFFARGTFELFQATREVRWLAVTMDLAEAIEREFYDPEAGTLYYTPKDGESLITRPQELTDQSTPSSIGVATELLDKLDHFRTDDRFAEVAETVIETQGNNVKANPLQHASLTLASDTVTYGTLEATLVTDDKPEAWLEEFEDRYLGSRIVAWRPIDEEEYGEWLETLGLDEDPSIWADRDARLDHKTAYVCRARTCSPPRNQLSTALAWSEHML